VSLAHYLAVRNSPAPDAPSSEPTAAIGSGALNPMDTTSAPNPAPKKKQATTVSGIPITPLAFDTAQVLLPPAQPVSISKDQKNQASVSTAKAIEPTEPSASEVGSPISRLNAAANLPALGPLRKSSAAPSDSVGALSVPSGNNGKNAELQQLAGDGASSQTSTGLH